MTKILTKPDAALFPVPVILVTSADKEGRPNIITLAWCGMVCSEPPQLSISIRPHRYSHQLIKETGEFVVNIPSAELVKQVDGAGVVSGKTVDKFKEFNFTPVAASAVKPPLIKECPVNIECKVKESHVLGTHEVFIGEIAAVHIDEEVVGQDGKIDYKKTNPFTYCHGEYWTLDKKVGSYGYSKK